MSVNMAELLVDTIDGGTDKPRQTPAVEAAGIYEGDMKELGEREQLVLEELARIKVTAIKYAQGGIFLGEMLYPPEDNGRPNSVKKTHAVNIVEEDGELVIHRTASMPTESGAIVVDVASRTSPEEVARLTKLFAYAQENGIMNSDGTGFSDRYKRAQLALMRSGIETEDEQREAVVTFGPVDSAEAFVLNGSIQRKLANGESVVVDDQLLAEEGVTDLPFFEAVSKKLGRSIGANV